MNSIPIDNTASTHPRGLYHSDMPTPLIKHFSAKKTFVVSKGRAISQEEFLRDVLILADLLPNAEAAFNLCEDRYFFLVAFCAVILRRQKNLLPPNRHNSTINELSKSYTNSYCLTDGKDSSNSSSDRKIASYDVTDILNKATTIPSETQAPPLIDPDQIVAILYTSGSTGTPKPNAKTWGALVGSAHNLQQRFNSLSSSNTLVATVPSQHMYGLETTVMMALQADIILISETPFFPSEVHALLNSISTPRVLVTTPIHLRAMVRAELTMPSVATVISATAPLDLSLAQESENCFSTELFEIYGCTEAGSIATRRSSQTQVWQLLNGFSLNMNQNIAEIEATHFAGKIVLQDLIEPIDEQLFLLGGRTSDMVKVAGKRASLSELTLHLQTIQGVKDGVIFWPSDAIGQQESRLAGLVVSDRSEKEILAELALRIDAAFLPRPLYKVASLPRNETGKLTSAALASLWSEFRGNR